MYFKDGAYAQQASMPRMVSSVRPPLMPDGYHTTTDGTTPVTSLQMIMGNPWYIAIIAAVIVAIVWFMMKK
jgi:hypothetical protein